LAPRLIPGQSATRVRVILGGFYWGPVYISAEMTDCGHFRSVLFFAANISWPTTTN
jgi:hypothetical protein